MFNSVFVSKIWSYKKSWLLKTHLVSKAADKSACMVKRWKGLRIPSQVVYVSREAPLGLPENTLQRAWKCPRAPSQHCKWKRMEESLLNPLKPFEVLEWYSVNENRSNRQDHCLKDLEKCRVETGFSSQCMGFPHGTFMNESFKWRNRSRSLIVMYSSWTNVINEASHLWTRFFCWTRETCRSVLHDESVQFTRRMKVVLV